MLLYDPPAGWRYGFPKLYSPLNNETLVDTLLRDGYPQYEIDYGGAKYVRFLGSNLELPQCSTESSIKNSTRTGWKKYQRT